MLKSRNLALFERLVEQGADPMLAANTLENTLVSLRRDGIVIADPDSLLPEIFALYGRKMFVKSAIPDVLKEAAAGRPLAEVVNVYSIISGSELGRIAKELNYDIKAIMSRYRTRINPEELQKLMKEKKGKEE